MIYIDYICIMKITDMKHILAGHYNELTDKNRDLSKERMDICKKCPLIKQTSSWGPICNNELFLNKETNETSIFHKTGFQKGCGCRLNAKTKDKSSHCPLSKW